MHSARFVDLLSVYAGVVQFVQFAVVHRLQLTLNGLSTLAMGVIFCSFAVIRARQPTDKLRPAEYGPFVYVLVVICLILTAIAVGFVLG